MQDHGSGTIVREGQILAGKYRIDRMLGVGGMGIVFAAYHVQLEDRVAIKLLRPEALSNPDAVARFVREARAAVKIRSEHVARVLDVGTLESGAPYMVMECLEGRDLASWLAAQGPLALELAVEFVLQACEAIAEAHSIGIIHRDLKPANLFVTQKPDGSYFIKVLDFGISKLTGLSASGAQDSMTSTTALIGSPLYMSPEQMQASRNVDIRCDIWSLGIILHELVTGASPFASTTMPELVLKVATSSPEPVRNKRPELPAAFEALVLHCLEKDREKRCANVAELAEGLSEFAPRRAIASVERIVGLRRREGTGSSTLMADATALPAHFASDTSMALGRTEAGSRKSGKAIVAAFVALGAASGLVFAAYSRTPATQEPSARVVSAQPAELAASATPAPPLPQEPSAQAEPSAAPEPALEDPAQAGTAEPDLAPLPLRRTAPLPAALAPVAQPKRPSPPERKALSAPGASSTAAQKKPNCERNFYLDAQGEKHFKPECF